MARFALFALFLASLSVAAAEPAPTIRVLLGAYYTDSGQRETHDMAVHVIQKTGSDNDNIVVVICGDGYTKDDQEKYIADARRMWAGALAYEPYRTFAHRFNVYAVSTVSKGAWGSGETFFNSSVLSDGRSLILSGNRCKNHIMERCIGPAFIRDYHDARRQEPFKDPDAPSDDENAPYYGVYDYIRVFVVLANSDRYMGGSAINLEYAFQYVASSAGNSSIPTLAHELGHAMLHLGDEYSTGQMTDAQAARALNISATGDPARLRWKTLLGFRGTYPVPYQHGAQSFNSSSRCTMSRLTDDFCELCRLQGAKRMATLMADGQDGLYVATPELLAVTERYAKPADFAPATISGYNAFATDYANRLYSGTGRDRFKPQDMAGQTLRLRTVVQNFSVTRARRVRLSFALKSAAGATLHSVEQVYDVGPWADRAKFDVGGHCLEYTGPENFDSGLANCELLYAARGPRRRRHLRLRGEGRGHGRASRRRHDRDGALCAREDPLRDGGRQGPPRNGRNVSPPARRQGDRLARARAGGRLRTRPAREPRHGRRGRCNARLRLPRARRRDAAASAGGERRGERPRPARGRGGGRDGADGRPGQQAA